MMPNELVLEYRKLINKHFAAVQTDTALEHTDNWELEKKARQFWEEFRVLEIAFIDKLEKVNV